ncbi:ImmA/IrrE family metallo-endopeptidase [Phycicoccus sp. DTK01]|uniref:ImmA/IrrE family metallo-endopeptidase n=1 Tax=Phycicoccus sp. DTK01 TaxID=2785745 RepID=UPI001A8C135B|nr:hypothetical protein [Phycicoccus sp. DTK01]
MSLVLAEQAIDAAEPGHQRYGDFVGRGERASPDWAASALLDLVHMQLLELRRVVERLFEDGRAPSEPEHVRSALLERAGALTEPERNSAEYDVCAVAEGLELLDALSSDNGVDHGFAVDGSISLTTGPVLPPLPTLGVKGSENGELEDEPDKLLSLAASLTRAAGALYWVLPPVAGEQSRTEAREAPESASRTGGRRVSGSPTFVAASRLDESVAELTFEQALGLARLVIQCGGGPAVVGGKRGLLSSSTARHLTALGLVERVEVGTVQAVYEAQIAPMRGHPTAPTIRTVGVRDRAKLAVAATTSGSSLVGEALADHGVATSVSTAVPHAPLDRREFGQLELDLGAADPTEDEVAKAVRGLIQEAMTYRDGPAVAGLLRLIGRFTKLAPYNALLLDAQAPGSRYVLPAHKWLEDWDHRVKPGERPRIILRTFGPVLPVFDVSQVEPSDDSVSALPPEIRDPFGMAPLVGADHAFDLSARTARSEGIRITRTHDGSGSAGSARSAWGSGTMSVARSERAKPHVVPVTIDIEINRDLDDAAAYATLAHELGHVYCGHVGSPTPDLWPNRNVSTEEAECEAEAVAYIACLRLDPNAVLPPHLHQYLSPGEPVPPIDLEVVTRAAGRVINLYESPGEVWRKLTDRLKKAERRGR